MCPPSDYAFLKHSSQSLHYSILLPFLVSGVMSLDVEASVLGHFTVSDVCFSYEEYSSVTVSLHI